MANGEYRKAINVLGRVMEMTEPDPVVYNDVGFCYMMLNEPEQGLEALDEALALGLDNEEALHNISLLLTEKSDLKEAERALYRAAQIAPEFSEIQADYGRFLMRHDRLRDAVRILRAASTGSSQS